MISTETLESFCDQECRYQHLKKPWTVGEWTYASNGYIVIRVPTIDEYDQGPFMESIHPNSAMADVAKVESGRCGLLPAFMAVIDWNNKSVAPVALDGGLFAYLLYGKILGLPSVSGYVEPWGKGHCIRFMFDGGIGMLLGMRKDSEMS
jgi:hypothetical protein